MSRYFLFFVFFVSIPSLSQASPTESQALKPLKLPQWSSDVLSVTNHFSFQLGQVRFDNELNQTSFNLSGSALIHYFRMYESKRFGYQFQGAISTSFSSTNIAAEKPNLFFRLDPNTSFSFRYYPIAERNKFFLTAALSGSYSLNVTTEENSPIPDIQNKSILHSWEVSSYFGAGFGRFLLVGSLLRLKKLESYLLRKKVIQSPFSNELKKKLLLHWYTLRNQIGFSQQLAYTISLLRQAGVLRRSLQPTEVYVVVNIIRDPQFLGRGKGWRVRAAIDLSVASGSIFVSRERTTSFLVEQASPQLGAHVFAMYAKPFGLNQQFSWEGIARTTFGTFDGSLASLVVGTQGGFAWNLYNEAMDPLGVLSIFAHVEMGTSLTNVEGNRYNVLTRIPNDFLTTSQLWYEWLGVKGNLSLSYHYHFSQGTRLSLGLNASAHSRFVGATPHLGISFHVTYEFGVIQGFYSQAGSI